MTTNNVEVLSCNAIVKDFCKKHDPRNNQPLRKALVEELLRGEFHIYFFKSDFPDYEWATPDSWDEFVQEHWDDLADDYLESLKDALRNQNVLEKFGLSILEGN